MFRTLSKQPNLTIWLSLFFALLTACGTSKQSEPTMAAEPTNSVGSLARQDRIEIFEDVWGTISEEYYDPSFNGVNWQEVHQQYRPRVEAAANDAEFYRQLEEMLAELRDAHTRFGYPQPRDAREGQPTGSVGISLGEVEGKTVIVAVEPESDAARVGVLPGMILRTVNGRPVEQLFAEIRSGFAGSSSERAMQNVMHNALLYGGFIGASRTFGIEGFNGAVFNVEVIHRGASPPSPLLTARRLPSGHGYIRFDSWQSPAGEQFRAVLARLMDTPGLVVDLRGNGGGTKEVQLDIVSNFFPSATNYGVVRYRRGNPEPYTTNTPERVYRGRLVVLVGVIKSDANKSKA